MYSMAGGDNICGWQGFAAAVKAAAVHSVTTNLLLSAFLERMNESLTMK